MESEFIFMSDICTQIINSIDIADIIGEKVKLRKTNRGFMGLCPFHSEKTPSFHVFSDTQTYYCFGCHEAGNIFSFVMKTEGLNFREALELLAARAGIKLQNYEGTSKTKTPNEILEFTAKFFTSNLVGSQGNAARAYMKRRNLNQNDITKFSLGYSLNSWDSLVNFLSRAGIDGKKIFELGLSLQGRHGFYDRFRGRLMFPIKDITGKIIAFGGRLIDGEGAKYINSPESEIYSKRKNLYLLNDARKSIREKKRVILVEGYMDAIRLHKAGFTETVASLGTSLTSEQAELLARFSDVCYICYDSDEAGQNAALKGMYILAENGLDVRVVAIPDGKDPDEFLTSNPPEKFEDVLRDSKPLILRHIEALKPMLSNLSTRRKALKELFDGLSKLPPENIEPYKAELSYVTHIPPSELNVMILNGFGNAKNSDYVQLRHETKSEFENKIDYDILEKGFCAMLYHYPECRLKIKPEEIYKILKNPVAQETALALLIENFENVQALWISTEDTQKFALIAQGEKFCQELGNINVNQKWEKIYNGLKTNLIIQRNKELREKLLNNTITPEELAELSKLMNVNM